MNKIAILAAAALTATTFGVAGAFAQSGADDFAKADANHDGGVDLTEAQGVFPTLTQDIFTKADANADGKLDEAEFGSLQGLTAGLDQNSTSSASAASSSAPSSSSAAK